MRLAPYSVCMFANSTQFCLLGGYICLDPSSFACPKNQRFNLFQKGSTLNILHKNGRIFTFFFLKIHFNIIHVQTTALTLRIYVEYIVVNNYIYSTIRKCIEKKNSYSQRAAAAALT